MRMGGGGDSGPARRRIAALAFRGAVFVLAVAAGAVFADLHAQHPRWEALTGDPDPCAASTGAEHARCERKEARRASATLRASRAYHARLADRLAAEGGARHLALAANLRAMSLAGESFVTESTLPRLAGDTRLAAWRDAAEREGRDDPFVLGLLIRPLSPDDDDARRRGVRASWRTLEPANLLVLSDDGAPDVAEILASAGEGRRFDVHFGALLRAMLDAVERHPPNAREARWLFDDETPTPRAYAISLALTLLELPRFIPVVDACKGEALSQPGRREACARHGAVLADASDTLIAHMIGLAILRNIAEDAQARDRIEERRRRAAWLRQQWHDLGKTQPARMADAQAEVLRASPDIGEMDVMRRVLEMEGVSVQPPEDFHDVRLP